MASTDQSPVPNLALSAEAIALRGVGSDGPELPSLGYLNTAVSFPRGHPFDLPTARDETAEDPSERHSRPDTDRKR